MLLDVLLLLQRAFHKKKEAVVVGDYTSSLTRRSAITRAAHWMRCAMQQIRRRRGSIKKKSGKFNMADPQFWRSYSNDVQYLCL